MAPDPGNLGGMAERSQARSIDEYIAEFPSQTQAILQQVRSTIHDAAPEATETISYAIPTFDLRGKHLVHFAGYPHHSGFYPTPRGIEEFDAELSRYKQGRGSVQFPIDQPMPLDLIRRIVEFRARDIAGKR